MRAALSFLLLSLSLCEAFLSPSVRHQRTVTSIFVMLPSAPSVQVAAPIQTTTPAAAQSALSHGIDGYLQQQSSANLALVERKIPTAEEIAAKKRNFNVIFWGGGFVAPFLATIFYFGFRFWEK